MSPSRQIVLLPWLWRRRHRDHAVRPHRRFEVVASEHLTEPLGRLLEPHAPPPVHVDLSDLGEHAADDEQVLVVELARGLKVLSAGW